MKGMSRLIRKKLKEDWISASEVSAKQLISALNLTSQRDKHDLYRTLHDFVKRGEVKALTPGVYKYLHKSSKKELKSTMWRLLRARKTVTIEDIQELSGASRKYVVEWLKMLEKRGIVRRFREGKYRLVKDTVVEPENTEKAFRIRELRKKRKEEALTALNDASIAINTAKTALSALDAETD
jgi:DNA-binding transcriptional ArsR family regulator